MRGPLDAPKFKDYILPLIFLKRLSDVFDDEVEHVATEMGNAKLAADLVEQDHGLVRFYVPEAGRWSALKQKTTGLGQYLTDAVRAVARENPRLQGVIDMVDFNATAAGQRMVDDGRFAAPRVSANKVGDESFACRLAQTETLSNGTKLDMTVYILAFRKGRVNGMVLAGSMIGGGFEDAQRLADLMASRIK